jgi:hypothetical protein
MRRCEEGGSTRVSRFVSWEIEAGRFSKVNLLLEKRRVFNFFNRQRQSGKFSKLLSSNQRVVRVTRRPNCKKIVIMKADR